MEVLKAIVQAFLPDISDFSINPLGDGNINDTYRVQDQQTSYLLQRINHDIFKAPQTVIENYQKVYDKLSSSSLDLQLPKLFHTATDKAFFKDTTGNYWRLLEFVPNSIGYEVVGSVQQVRQAAGQLGTFLNLVNQAPAPHLKDTIPNFHNFAERYQGYQEILAKDRLQRAEGVQNIIQYLHEQALQNPDYNTLGIPQRIVHNDPKIGNFLFDASGKILAIIDWDTMMKGYILSDFGDMVRTMCPTASEDEADLEQVWLNLDYLEAICANLLPPIRDLLTPLEKEYFYTGAKYIVLEQLLRFLGDYLNGDQYYKINYPLHNLHRTQNQMKLHQELIRYEERIKDRVNAYL